jgi:hypothetical protein
MLGGGPEDRVASYRRAMRVAGPPAPAPVDGMQLALFPACPGTVIVHRDMAVSCTNASCCHSVPRTGWFGLHSTFVPCGEIFGGGEFCRDCGFEQR